MARKSGKASSGHLPLTSHERTQYSKGSKYGTTAARLGGASQLSFGHCALSLHPAKEQPVATTSGFVYERAAILEYLLTKTQELKQQQREYERHLQQVLHNEEQEEKKKRKAQLEDFESSQKVVSSKRRKAAEENPLKRTSYWLAEVQPESDEKVDRAPPPKRPPSPNSKKPLRRKDLIDLDLKFNAQDQVLCAVSEKSIVSQQALALIPKAGRAQVILEQVYNDLGKERDCPVTGKKIHKILKLQKGGSSFAGTGSVLEAKTYRPSMT